MSNHVEEPRKTSGLAIAALVLSIVMCVPIFPIVGIVLGIVALVKINANPRLSGKGLAIAAIAVGAVGIVTSLGVTAAVAIPSFIGYIRRAKQVEAADRLGQIARMAESYYGMEHASVTGAPLPRQFPASTPVTPTSSCAESPDGRCPPDPTAWQHPTWQALGFALSDPHYYRYQFVNEGSSFRARAIGDLDADGVFSTFERSGTATADGQVVIAPVLVEHMPNE